MPTLQKFLDEGVQGDLTTLQPILSPMLWNSIATGVRADQHGVLGFTEVCAATGNVRPVSGVSRKVRALWNMANLRGLRSHVVNWFCSDPAEPINGVFISDAVVSHLPLRRSEDPGVSPRSFHVPADLTDTLPLPMLAGLRVLPEEIEPSILQLFVPRAAEIDQDKDRRLTSLAKVLAESFTVHNYAVTALSAGDWNLAAFYYPSIDHFSHAFMDFHPPRRPHINEAQYDLYHDVVNGGYRLHDRFLARLLHLAGDDATVLLLSDHGFHSDHLRPLTIPKTPTGPEVQHRELGIFALRGPGVKRGERVYGASLLDITPTALTVLGLPVGADMPGRVLAEAFVTPPSVETIPSWEAETGDDGRFRGDYILPQMVSDGLLAQFVGLGYIDPQDNDRTRAAAITERERRWNLARTHAHAGRYDLATPLLQAIHAEAPERRDFAVALAEGLWRVGLGDQARELLLALSPAVASAPSLTPSSARSAHPRLHYLLAVAALESGAARDALEHLAAAEAQNPANPLLYVRLGHAYLRLRRIADAERAFGQALERDENEPSAHLGLAVCALRAGRSEDAALHALKAIALRRPGRPRARGGRSRRDGAGAPAARGGRRRHAHDRARRHPRRVRFPHAAGRHHLGRARLVRRRDRLTRRGRW